MCRPQHKKSWLSSQRFDRGQLFLSLVGFPMPDNPDYPVAGLQAGFGERDISRFDQRFLQITGADRKRLFLDGWHFLVFHGDG